MICTLRQSIAADLLGMMAKFSHNHVNCFFTLHKQALRNSCELLRRRKELHARSGNCMQAQVTACKLM